MSDVMNLQGPPECMDDFATEVPDTLVVEPLCRLDRRVDSCVAGYGLPCLNTQRANTKQNHIFAFCADFAVRRTNNFLVLPDDVRAEIDSRRPNHIGVDFLSPLGQREPSPHRLVEHSNTAFDLGVSIVLLDRDNRTHHIQRTHDFAHTHSTRVNSSVYIINGSKSRDKTYNDSTLFANVAHCVSSITDNIHFDTRKQSA